MSKAWFIAVVLVLTGGISLAFGKVPDGRTVRKSAPPKAQPTPSASKPTPAPVHRPAPATASRQARAPTPARAPAVRMNPVPTVKSAPSVPASPRAAQSSGRIEHSSRRTESRSSQPALPTPASVASSLAAPKIAPKGATAPSLNLSNAAPAVPAGKIGKALGPMPASNHSKVDPGKPLLSTNHNHAGQQHPSHKPATRGLSTTSPLPTAPKFETNGKIPPFGSPLASSPKTSSTSSTHRHGHTSNATPRSPSHSITTAQPARKDHDDHHDPRHTRDRRHDDHHHSSHYGHSSGSRRSGGLSWLIIGGSSFGRNCYGYGSGYVAPAYFYTAPSEVYISTTVVNPDASINSYSSVGVVPPQQQQLTPDEFAALPLERQRDLLLQALNAMEEDFARSPNGEDWSRLLQLATIAKLVTDGDDRPDATLRVRLRSVVQLFDEVASNADYKEVSDLISFRVLHMGLHEFAAEEIDRSRRQLSHAASNLSKILETWSSGQRWRDYLQTEWMLGTDEEMQIDLEARLVRFEKLLDKFDRVKSDGQFQIVTQPREFGLAHDALRHFVEHLQQLVAEVRNAEQQNPEGELVIPAAPR